MIIKTLSSNSRSNILSNIKNCKNWNKNYENNKKFKENKVRDTRYKNLFKQYIEEDEHDQLI